MTEMLCGNFEKSFLEWVKTACRKISRHRNSSFTFSPLKNSLVRISSKLNSKLYRMIIYTNFNGDILYEMLRGMLKVER